MSIWAIVGIAVLVLGLIIGNLTLLKYSAKMPVKPDKNQKGPHEQQPPKS